MGLQGQTLLFNSEVHIHFLSVQCISCPNVDGPDHDLIVFWKLSRLPPALYLDGRQLKKVKVATQMQALAHL